MDPFTTAAPGLPSSRRSADWCKRLAAATNAGEGLPRLGCSFGLVTDPSNDYSIPIEYAPPGTPQRRLFFRPNWPGKFMGKIGQLVPWSSGWHMARGKDGHIAIIAESADPALPDVEIDLWGASSWEEQNQGIRPQSAAIGNIGNWFKVPPFNQRKDLVAATIVRTTLDGRTGDAFIAAPNSNGVTTAAEVASGHIGHAMRISIPCALKGPPAPATITDPDHPDVGVRYALAGLPCGMHESPYTDMAKRPQAEQTAIMAALQRCIPHGLRVVGQEIDVDRWLDTGSSTGPATRKALTGTLRTTSATIAECAAITHGLIPLVSSPADQGDTNVYFDGSKPEEWRELGIVGDGRTLLHGLFGDAGTIRALRWPTAARPDGTRTSRAAVGVYPTYA